MAQAGAAGRATPSRHYRADIDGLRAIAVLPVLLFHLRVRGFSGGFVGVDIFFVISGYLITAHLARDMAGGRHAIADFYRRRVLRIFPALFAMMAATTIAASFVLLPLEVGRYGETLAGAAMFVSNIVFYLRADYFNPGGVSQPLLHTWSLAVEEQWYILWPLVLRLAGADRRRMLAAAVAISVASFAVALWWVPRDPAAAFYLLPARGWELGLGAGLALVPGAVRRGWWNEAMALLGLALIAASVKLLTKDSPFPGWAALPPCLGAALLIRAGEAASLGSSLLAWRPLRWIGLISYSLYLWHWPVIVFAESGLFLGSGWRETIALIAVSFAAAILSWRFVERPFRQGGGRWTRGRVLGAGAVVMAAAVLIAAAMPVVQRVVSPFTPAQAELARYIATDGDAAFRGGVCFKVGAASHYDADRCLAASGRKPVILLVGDSHAAHLWPGLAAHRDRYDIAQATATGCLAALYPPDTADPCEQVDNLALRGWLAAHRPDALVLASRWDWRWMAGLEATLRDPQVHAAHPVLLGPVPRYASELPRLLVAADRWHDPGLVARALDRDIFALDAHLRAMAARTGTRYVSMTDLLCPGQVCRTLAAPGVPIQFDASHFTPAGSRKVVGAILPRIVAPR